MFLWNFILDVCAFDIREIEIANVNKAQNVALIGMFTPNESCIALYQPVDIFVDTAVGSTEQC